MGGPMLELEGKSWTTCSGQEVKNAALWEVPTVIDVMGGTSYTSGINHLRRPPLGWPEVGHSQFNQGFIRQKMQNIGPIPISMHQRLKIKSRGDTKVFRSMVKVPSDWYQMQDGWMEGNFLVHLIKKTQIPSLKQTSARDVELEKWGDSRSQ
ncbi:hypothetical protein C8R44DRAFT_747895 [Mycena epipterygia]|nr:hypothetical protein C8R44DRAFT_747895 [Mycena epipterygia]